MLEFAGGRVFHFSSLFSSYNSESVKLRPYRFVTLSSYLWDISMPNLISFTFSSPQIFGKFQMGIFSFSGLSNHFYTKDCHHFRTNLYTEMKFRPLSKPKMRNTKPSKRSDNHTMLLNQDVIVIFLILSRFRVIQRPDSGQTVHYLKFLLTFNFYPTKVENGTLKSL